MELSQLHSRNTALEGGVAFDSALTVERLAEYGVSLDEANPIVGLAVKSFIKNHNEAVAKEATGQDAAPAQGVTLPTNQVPVQFLQHWMSRIITVVTQARLADKLLGRANYGEWWQEEIVLRVRELQGSVRPYGDHAQPPLAGYNWNEEARTIVRFSQGILTGALEEARMKAMGQKSSAYESDRAALGLGFNINTNAVAFYGYILGRNKTYGILNDPNLLDYVAVPEVDGDTHWASKDYYSIVRDLNTAVAVLQNQCGGNFDPYSDGFTIAIALSCAQFLNEPNQLGLSVRKFIKDTWPKATVLPIPEFNNAVGGDNVMYLILDELAGNPVVEQIVPSAVRLVGAVPRPTGTYELYSDATAGCFVQQPLGIARFFGI